MEKPLAIIGIDPGTTLAFCALDLDGNMLCIGSGRELSHGKVISQLLQVCYPIITATDKQKCPDTVHEISTKLGTMLYTPDEDLLREDKRIMVLHYGPSKQHHNQHELDCLAAALFALRKFETKIRDINSYVLEHGISDVHIEFMKVALKETLSYQNIERLLHPPSLPIQKSAVTLLPTADAQSKLDAQKLQQQNRMLQRDQLRFAHQISQLLQEIRKLRKKNKALAKKKATTRQKLETLFSFKETRLHKLSEIINAKEGEFQRLSQKLRGMEEFMAHIESKNLVRRVANLGQDECSPLALKEGEMLLVDNADIYSEKVLDLLSTKNIQVLSTKKISAAIQHKVTGIVIMPDEIVHKLDAFAILKLQHRPKSGDFIQNIVEEYRKRR